VYHQIREDLEEQGVLFLDTDSGLRQHEDLFREYFASIIPVGDNKFAALNTAVWSGGSFIYVPKGVKVDIPLQAYFRINTENMGNLYGMRINMSDNEKSKIASNLKTDLLEQKLSLIRKNVNTYESLFRNAELRQSMQTITSKALQKTMTIHITAPIGTLFKGLGQ
jgi:Fe-S cluster assembly scaffold protein SufB